VDPRIARRRLTSARVGHLATVTVENRAHIVPCCFVVDAETIYSAVDDAKSKSTPALRRFQNISSNGAASLLADHYDEDWATLWWVRVDGKGRIVEDDVERERAIDLLAAKYEQYRSARPPGPVLAIAIGCWRMWP
jgi:PPOX class probable F420-dependent enzyme